MRKITEKSLRWETAEHETKTVMVSEADQEWTGEIRNDQRRIGELTAVSQSTLDTRLRKPQVYRGWETTRQEAYFVCKADNMCSGDRYPDLRTVKDTARGTMDTMKEVLQVVVGTDEKTWRDRAVQWEQWIRDRAVQWRQRALKVMSRGILPGVVNEVIFMERSPTAIITQCCIMHAASVEFLAMDWKLGPEQTGPEPVASSAMTR